MLRHEPSAPTPTPSRKSAKNKKLAQALCGTGVGGPPSPDSPIFLSRTPHKARHHNALSTAAASTPSIAGTTKKPPPFPTPALDSAQSYSVHRSHERTTSLSHSTNSSISSLLHISANNPSSNLGLEPSSADERSSTSTGTHHYLQVGAGEGYSRDRSNSAPEILISPRPTMQRFGSSAGLPSPIRSNTLPEFGQIVMSYPGFGQRMEKTREQDLFVNEEVTSLVFTESSPESKRSRSSGRRKRPPPPIAIPPLDFPHRRKKSIPQNDTDTEEESVPFIASSLRPPLAESRKFSPTSSASDSANLNDGAPPLIIPPSALSITPPSLPVTLPPAPTSDSLNVNRASTVSEKSSHSTQSTDSGKTITPAKIIKADWESFKMIRFPANFDSLRAGTTEAAVSQSKGTEGTEVGGTGKERDGATRKQAGMSSILSPAQSDDAPFSALSFPTDADVRASTIPEGYSQSRSRSSTASSIGIDTLPFIAPSRSNATETLAPPPAVPTLFVDASSPTYPRHQKPSIPSPIEPETEFLVSSPEQVQRRSRNNNSSVSSLSSFSSLESGKSLSSTSSNQPAFGISSTSSGVIPIRGPILAPSNSSHPSSHESRTSSRPSDSDLASSYLSQSRSIASTRRRPPLLPHLPLDQLSNLSHARHVSDSPGSVNSGQKYEPLRGRAASDLSSGSGSGASGALHSSTLLPINTLVGNGSEGNAYSSASESTGLSSMRSGISTSPSTVATATSSPANSTAALTGQAHHYHLSDMVSYLAESDKRSRRPSATSISVISSAYSKHAPERPPFPWTAVPIQEAKMVLSSSELQDIVMKSLIEYGEKDHRLVLENFEDIPEELKLSKGRLEDLQARFQADMEHRTKLLSRHVSCLKAFNGQEGARFAESLVNAVARSDRVAQELYFMSEHINRVEHIQDEHYRAAASLSLSKLNASFLRSRQREQEAKSDLTRVTAERDEALARLKSLEEKLEKFADAEGQVTMHLTAPAIVVDQHEDEPNSRRQSQASSISTPSRTPTTAVSFRLSDLRLNVEKFPLPPVFRRPSLTKSSSTTNDPIETLPNGSSPRHPFLRPTPLNTSARPPSELRPRSTSPRGQIGLPVSVHSSHDEVVDGTRPSVKYLFPRPAPSPLMSPESNTSESLSPSPIIHPLPNKSRSTSPTTVLRKGSLGLSKSIRSGIDAIMDAIPHREPGPSSPGAAVGMASSDEEEFGVASGARRFRSASEPSVVPIGKREITQATYRQGAKYAGKEREREKKKERENEASETLLGEEETGRTRARGVHHYGWRERHQVERGGSVSTMTSVNSSIESESLAMGLSKHFVEGSQQGSGGGDKRLASISLNEVDSIELAKLFAKLD